MTTKDQLINKITELDYLSLRQNLVTFMKNQSRFQDANFEGSNLSVLMDVLAYDTFYKAFYLNMMATEMNLSTATKRKNVVNRAKSIGYVPRSVRSASAELTLTLTPSGVPPPFIELPNGTKFTADIEGTKYIFQTQQSVLVYPVLGVYTTTVVVVEGRNLTFNFTVPPDNVSKVEIPNAGVDTSRLSVSVKTSSTTNDSVFFNPSQDFLSLTGQSLVYFVQEVDNERHQVYFGDGVVGRAVTSGNVVTIKYLVSAGSAANGAQEFTLVDTLPGVSNTVITTVSPSGNGGEIETISSIKLDAALVRQTQMRAVTHLDYTALVKENFASYDSVIAWGGQDNDPIALGYAFISIKPSNKLFLTESEKFAVETFLSSNFSVIDVVPIVVDPDFLFLEITSTVKFDPFSLVSTVAELKTAVIDTISQFSQENLESFSQYFRYNRLVEAIDSTNNAISNSLTTVRMQRRFNASTISPNDYTVRFFNALYPGTLRSRKFVFTHLSITYTTAFFKDNGLGVIGIFYIDLSNAEVVIPGQSSVGTVNYVTGVVQINGFEPDQIGSVQYVEIRITSQPAVNDVLISKNLVLTIEQADIAVTTLIDTVS